MSDYPAGIPDGEHTRCCVCRRLLRFGDAVYWWGFTQSVPGPFGGYFCSPEHRFLWGELTAEERIVAVFGDLEAGLRVLALAERREPDPEHSGVWYAGWQGLGLDEGYVPPDGETPPRLATARLTGWTRGQPAPFEGDAVQVPVTPPEGTP